MAQVAEYFAAKRHGLSGDCSLAELNVKTVGPAQVQQLLKADHGTADRHVRQKERLFRSYCKQEFPKWALELSEGASLCLYGWGSKRDVLTTFAESYLKPAGGCVVAIDGLKPGVTARAILLNTATAHISSNAESHNLPQLIKANRTKCDEDLIKLVASHESPLAVILHNIDGPKLQSRAAQALLSRLAALSHVSLLASFDHVDTPVLWDSFTYSRFNWRLHDATTYESQLQNLVQAGVAPAIAVGRARQVTEQSAAIAMQSFPQKARTIFRILVEKQREEGSGGGIVFKSLMQLCRIQFLVGNDASLKAHLTEFRDHDLATTKRADNGNELWYVPVEDDVLDTILADMDKVIDT